MQHSVQATEYRRRRSLPVLGAFVFLIFLISFAVIRQSSACQVEMLTAGSIRLAKTTPKPATQKQDDKPAKLTLTVSTEDDEDPTGVYLLYTHKPTTSKSDRTSTLQWPDGNKKHEFELPVATSRVVVVSNNFAPGWITFDRELESGKTFAKSVVLEKGIAHKFRVTDNKRKPISRVNVRPHVFLEEDVSFIWRWGVTNDQGEVTVLFPNDAIKHKATIFGQNYQRREVTLPLEANTTNVSLTKKAHATFQVLDHLGKPVKNNPVCVINSGSTFNNDDRGRPIWKTDDDGRFKIWFNSQRPYTASMVVETKTNRGVFKSIKTEPGKSTTLQMPEPRTLKFQLSGDRSILKTRTLRVLNGTYDAKRRQYVMQQPYRYNKDRSVLTVHGIVDGWVALSFKGEKGNLFWSQNVQSEPTEIPIDLDLFKEHQRSFRFVFLHDGKQVSPKGSLSFYVRSKESFGDKHQLQLSDQAGDMQWSGVFRPPVRDIRIVNSGLEDYYIDGIDGSIDHTVKLTPLQKLNPRVAQTISIPVRPSGVGSIQVLLPSGEPANQVSVRLYCQRSKSKENWQGTTNASGNFSVPKLEIKYRRDYRYEIQPGSGYQKLLAQKIRPGESVKVTLEKGIELSGRIVNQRKLPMSQMIVEAIDRSGNIVENTKTDFKGQFRFTSLSDEPVRIRARHISGGVDVKPSKRFKPGQGKPIELKAQDKRKYKFA